MTALTSDRGVQPLRGSRIAGAAAAAGRSPVAERRQLPGCQGAAGELPGTAGTAGTAF